MPPISVIVLLLVFLGIALRKIVRINLTIWHIVCFGALAVIVLGQISPEQTIKSINYDVILYLFGVFVLGRALEHSGYLSVVSARLFNRVKNGYVMLGIILIVFALGSAFFMNDTIAIICAPLILLLCRQQQQLLKPFLFGLAYAITFGSLLSSIGNPQNLVIASDGAIINPFLTFFIHFLVPTVFALIASFLIIAVFYKKTLQAPIQIDHKIEFLDLRLIRLCKISILLMVLLIIANITLPLFNPKLSLGFSAIALISILPILLLSKERVAIVRTIDWGTLCFFIGMFILMASVWNSGFLQHAINGSHVVLTHSSAIMVISICMSQLISNLPLVMLYLPILIHAQANTAQMMTLAAGSAIAGNLLIIGAASNIIIIQAIEKRGYDAFGFFEFLKLGLPLTLISLLIYGLL